MNLPPLEQVKRVQTNSMATASVKNNTYKCLSSSNKLSTACMLDRFCISISFWLEQTKTLLTDRNDIHEHVSTLILMCSSSLDTRLIGQSIVEVEKIP
jgi:hypothetical protein